MKKESHTPISTKRVVITSFLVDISDVVVNLVVALLTGSVVILAEMLQGVADMVGSGLLIVGVKRSQKKADEMHPFGFGKEIYFWTLLSAIAMVVLAATFSLYLGYQRILAPQPINNSALALGVIMLSIGTNGYAASLSYRRILNTKSPFQIWHTLRQTPHVASKNALIQDTMGTLSSVTGFFALILYTITGNGIFDGIGAMITGTLLIILAGFLIFGLRDFVVGRSASPSTIKRIRHAVLTVPEVQDILELKTMIIGHDRILVNIEVHLLDNLTTNEIEELIDLIKHEVQSDVPSVKHIQVELESPEK